MAKNDDDINDYNYSEKERESLNFYCILATGPNSKLKVIIKHIYTLKKTTYIHKS